MKLINVLTVVLVIVVAGITYYLVSPLLFQKTYEGKIHFDISGEASFEDHSYYIGGSHLGSFGLKSGDKVIVEELEFPVGGSVLQYHYVLLIDYHNDQIVDAEKFTVINPSKLTVPYDGTFTIGIGVIKTILYDPENSVGVWEVEITIKK